MMVDEAVLGAIMPLIIDQVNKYVDSSKWRYIISLVFCLGVGVITNYKELRLDSVLASASVVFASAQTVYKMYWEKSQARSRIIQ